MKKNFLYSMYTLVLSIFLAATPPKDNSSYLDELKSSAMHVIKSNQGLINKNSDGSYTDKGLTPDKFAKATRAHFKIMVSSEKWKIEDLQNSNDFEQLAKAISTYLAASRIIVASYQGLINKDKDGSVYSKRFYPAVFGRLVADEFKKRTGIYIKQTTTGKNMGPRNSKYNNPDEWEKNILVKFENEGSKKAKGVGEFVTIGSKEYYRYMRPLSIKRPCLSCHGEPRGEKDIAGYSKEGYVLNEVRGGISVMVPTH